MIADRQVAIVDAMTTYLVERYLPGRDRAWLEETLARLPLEQEGVVYLGSIYIPEDESCLCRFEASDAEDVRLVNELARVPFARITAATELAATATGHDKGGEPQ